MIVEVAGVPGAGKSFLQRRIVEVLTENGEVAVADSDAVSRCLHRSPAARAVRALPGATEGRVRSLLVYGFHGGLAAASRPLASALVLLSVVRSPLSWGHRWVIFRRYVAAAGRDRFLRRHLHPWETAVVDEGMVHRAINAFAWRTSVPVPEIASYVRNVRLPDVVLVLDVNTRTAFERASARGLPERLRGRDDGEARAFVDRSRSVLDVAAAAEGLGGRMVKISTELPPEGSVLLAAVESVPAHDRFEGMRHDPGEYPPCSTTPVFEAVAFPAIRRPDRTQRASRRVPREDGDDWRAAAAGLGLQLIGKPRALGGGRSSLLAVATAQGPVVLKRYKPTLADGAIESEHEVLGELARLHFPSPRLVASPTGESVVRIGTRRWAGFRWLAGYVPAHSLIASPRGAVRLARQSGRALAALHCVLGDFAPTGVSELAITADGSRARPMEWYAARADEVSASGSRVRAAARLAFERFAGLDRQLGQATMGTTVIHGDYGPYNLLVRVGEPIVINDFELTRRDWALVDLATSLPRFAQSRVRFSPARAKAFVEGYLECRPAATREIALVPVVQEYVALRRAIVCWSRWQATGDVAALAEAEERERFADRMRTGRHPLAALWS
jgi:Ser/Thr protein kinase RdoA (MazF antagonist)